MTANSVLMVIRNYFLIKPGRFTDGSWAITKVIDQARLQ